MCLWCLLFLNGAFLQGIVVTGSDLFSNEIRDAVLIELEAAGMDAVVSFDGSLQGLRNLESGLVDASLLALPENADLRTSLRKYPLCFQIVACAVHATNPVFEISFPDLVNLYDEGGTTDSWSSLTDDPSWSNRNVSLMASRRQNSITLELFNAMVLKGEEMKPTLRYVSGPDSELLSTVVEDPAALVLMPLVDITGPVKFLGIKRTEDDQAYTPSIDNVFFGDYPLRLSFYLVVAPSTDTETVAQLLEVLYSEAVTSALEAANFVPVPAPEQRAMLLQFQQ